MHPPPPTAPSAPSTASVTSNQRPPAQHVSQQPRKPNGVHNTATASTSKAPPTPSASANSPSGRWESLYVYAFLVKFLPPKVDDLYDAMGFEEALLSEGFNQVIYDILVKFLGQLRPVVVRDLSPETLTATLAIVLTDLCKSKDITAFYDEKIQQNVHPLTEDVIDFFDLSWQDKIVILRQMVDWMLVNPPVKDVIDIAWEVKYQRKKKKTNKTLAAEFAPPDEDDPMSFMNLRMIPIGQDTWRTRYWTIDDSPRIWTSPNPWRMNCPISILCSTVEDFQKCIEHLKSTLPAPANVPKRGKYHTAHQELITALEAKLVNIKVHEKRVKAEKEKRRKQKEEEEEARLLVEEEEERRKEEMASRTRSKLKSGKGQSPDSGAEITEPATSKVSGKGKVKARKSATGTSKSSKKRKREPTPEESQNPDEIDELADDDDDEAFDYEATIKAAKTKKKAAAEKKGKKKRTKVEEEEEEPAEEPKEEEPQEEPIVAPEESDHEPDDDLTPPPASPKKKSDKSGTSSKAPTDGTETPPERPVRTARLPRPRPLGSRRSSRLARNEVLEDLMKDEDDIKSDSVADIVEPLKSATLREDSERPSKKRKSARKSKAKIEGQDEDEEMVDEAFATKAEPDPKEGTPTSQTKAKKEEKNTKEEQEEAMDVDAEPEPVVEEEVPASKAAPIKTRRQSKRTASSANVSVVNGWAIQPDSEELPSPQKICV